MIKIYICDDDLDFLCKIKYQINDCISKGKFGDFEYEITDISNPVSALQKIKTETPDITFLDIDMPNVNGFNVADEINRQCPDTLIIFVTNYDNYVYTSIRYRPFRFIRKSHISTEINEALNSALNEIICKNRYLELGSKYFNEKIFLSNIISIESNHNYAEIITDSGNKYKHRCTLSKLEDELKDFDFVRVHSGFIVNMRHIQLIKQNTVQLSNGITVDISRRLHKQVCERYSEYMRK